MRQIGHKPCKRLSSPLFSFGKLINLFNLQSKGKGKRLAGGIINKTMETTPVGAKLCLVPKK